MTTAAVLRHVEIEGPGLLEEMLKARGISYRIIDATRQEIPNADILITMGGPMSVNDNHPWIQEEIRAIKSHIDAGRYAFGVCLGAQMIAKAVGGEITQAWLREVGNYMAELTPNGRADKLFSGIQETVPVFHWHGETFGNFPGGTVVLAKGNGLNQAFRHGNAYGLQFHWEPTEGMVEAWIAADTDYLKGVPTSPESVLKDFKLNSTSYRSSLHAVFGRFLDAASGK